MNEQEKLFFKKLVSDREENAKVIEKSSIYNNKFINSIKVGYSDNFGAAETVMATKVERILFNKENFIEDNSYVTGHDTVNVFGLSDMKYFIKVNDNAIDIQLKK